MTVKKFENEQNGAYGLNEQKSVTKILVTVSFDVKHYWSYPSIVKIFIKEEPEIELPRIVLCLNSLHSKVKELNNLDFIKIYSLF